MCEDRATTERGSEQHLRRDARLLPGEAGPGAPGHLRPRHRAARKHADGGQDRGAVRRVPVLELLRQDPLHGRRPRSGRRRGRRRAGALALLGVRRGLGPAPPSRPCERRRAGRLRVLSQRGGLGPATPDHARLVGIYLNQQPGQDDLHRARHAHRRPGGGPRGTRRARRSPSSASSAKGCAATGWRSARRWGSKAAPKRTAWPASTSRRYRASKTGQSANRAGGASASPAFPAAPSGPAPLRQVSPRLSSVP